MDPIRIVGPVLLGLFLVSPDSQISKGRSIETQRFDARGPAVRSFVTETVIAAPVREVYLAWTDGEAFRRAYGAQRTELTANIDLEIGGRYEWLWDGKVGGNGCQVLSYIPDRLVTFTWNAPPSQPESRAKLTWVVVEFESLSAAATGVRLTHLGFGEAAHWDETFEYFQNAWPHVFESFKLGMERRDEPPIAATGG